MMILSDLKTKIQSVWQNNEDEVYYMMYYAYQKGKRMIETNRKT